MTAPAAVVFDCDGVLVDSEPHSVVSWLTVLGRLGHPATAADIDRCVGLGFLPTREALALLGPLPEPEVLAPALHESLAESFRNGLRRFPDAIEALAACERARLPLAVASASARSRLDLTLKSADLAHRFAVSVAGDEVTHGKPAPDVYLRAAHFLGIDPKHCIAIEDSPIGAQSAVTAGMRTIGVARRAHDRDALLAAGAEVVEVLTGAALGL